MANEKENNKKTIFLPFFYFSERIFSILSPSSNVFLLFLSHKKNSLFLTFVRYFIGVTPTSLVKTRSKLLNDLYPND